MKTKLTKQEKNKIKLINQLSASFRRSFPGLKHDKHLAPIRIKDIEKKMSKQ